MSKYGEAPVVVGNIQVECPEMMFVQYMPIVMPCTDLRLPENLEFCFNLIEQVMHEVSSEDYLYLTAKCLYTSNGYSGNREGWHSDGFGTNDINFIWSDSSPTEFCIQEFKLSNDCKVSMQEMQDQAVLSNIYTYPVNSLLRLNSSVIHRVSPTQSNGIRTFVKLSISKEKYNLKGNAHNYLFDYNWDMYEREEVRNHPTK